MTPCASTGLERSGGEGRPLLGRALLSWTASLVCSAPAAVQTDARPPRGAGGAEGPRWDCGARLPPLHLQAMRCRHSGLRGAGGARGVGGAGRESGAAAPGPAVFCLGRPCDRASGLDTQTSGWGRLARGQPPVLTMAPPRPAPRPISGRAPLPPHSASLLEHSRLGVACPTHPQTTATAEWGIHA